MSDVTTSEQGSSSLYQPLPPAHIRVLRLEGFVTLSKLAGTNDVTDGPMEYLATRLETISLEDVCKEPEKYSALSYCWELYYGSQSSRAPYILCDGRAKLIGWNLFYALWNIAKKQEQPSAIWADAMCINQSDVGERSQQVSIMGNIYRSMGCVIVWLGDYEKEVAALFGAFSDYGRGESPEIAWSVRNSRIHIAGSYEEPEPQYPIEDLQHGLTFLRGCGWFNRVWTFQEICLARRAIVMAGTLELDWDTFNKGWDLIAARENQFDDRRHTAWKLELIESARHESARNDGGNLLKLLRTVWNRDASDLRDKAYGVLGLCRSELVPRPDYNATLREVLVQVSKAAVEDSCCLEILHYASPFWKERGFPLPFPQEDPTVGWHIPTWMPDWVHSPDWFDLRGRDLSTLAKLEFPELDANFVFDVQWNNDRLVAAGFALGRRYPQNSSVPDAGRLQPFPDCAFKRSFDNECAWPSDPKFKSAFSSPSPARKAVKTDMKEFIFNVRMHDQGKCACLHASANTNDIARLELDDLRHNEPISSSLFEPPSEWLVVLFGTRAPAHLCLSDVYWSTRMVREEAADWTSEVGVASNDKGAEENVQYESTFVLLTTVDSFDRRSNTVYDCFDTIRIFAEKSMPDRSGEISCVYGDFEIE
jgi:hypothetical protein